MRTLSLSVCIMCMMCNPCNGVMRFLYALTRRPALIKVSAYKSAEHRCDYPEALSELLPFLL